MIGKKGQIQLPAFSPPSHLHTYIHTATYSQVSSSFQASFLPFKYLFIPLFLKTPWILALPLLNLSICATGSQVLLGIFRKQEPSLQDTGHRKVQAGICKEGCHLLCRNKVAVKGEGGTQQCVCLLYLSKPAGRPGVVCVTITFSYWGIRCSEGLRHTYFSKSWSWSLYIPFIFSDTLSPFLLKGVNC